MNHRIPSEKRALVLSLVSEGTPINAICRILHVGKHAVLRIIAETGAALADYMHNEFRDLTVDRLALDEQWQYVGEHGPICPSLFLPPLPIYTLFQNNLYFPCSDKKER